MNEPDQEKPEPVADLTPSSNKTGRMLNKQPIKTRFNRVNVSFKAIRPSLDFFMDYTPVGSVRRYKHHPGYK